MNDYRCRIAGLLLGALALLGACSDESAPALLQSARQYIAKNDRASAVIQLKSALQKAPDSPEGRFLLGSVLLESGDAIAAQIELRKALGFKHPPAQVVPVLARAMLSAGQHQKLTGEFGRIDLRNSAAMADLKTSLAIAYAIQGKATDADTALQAALQADPQYGRARVQQARFKAEAGDFDAAMEVIDSLLKKSPDNYEAWQFKAGLLYAVKHDAAGALDAQRQALKARPDLAASRAMIVAILLDQKDIAGARAALAEWKKIAPNHPEAAYFEATLALGVRDFKTAKEIVQKLLQVAPNNVRVLQLAGSLELQSGSTLQAESYLTKALQLAPGIAGLRRQLVQAHLRSGHADKAKEVLAPLLQLKDVDASTLALAGQVSLMNNDPAAAEGYFARAAKLDPSDTRSRVALALGQISNGEVERGMAQLRELAAADKGAAADLALISAYLRQGDADKALLAIDSLEKKQPAHPNATFAAFMANLRGQIQLNRKESNAARQSFERALASDPVYLPAIANLALMDVADKKPEQARKRFEAVLAADPSNKVALLAIAGLRANAGASKEEVIGLLTNAVRLNPTEAAPRVLLIDAQMRNNDLKSALSTAQESVAALPDSPELRQALASVQLAQGDTSQAITSLNRAVELRPGATDPLLRLAELHLKSKNVDAARQSLERALAIKPDLLAAQRGLIMIELSAGRPAEARAVARRVQSVPATRAVGLLLAGDIEASQKNWPAAAAAYRAGLKLSDSSELATKLHVALLATSAPDAQKFASDWSTRHPDNSAFLTHLGGLALDRQDYAGAIDAYTAVLRVEPNNVIALNNLAWASYRLNRPGALAYAEKANALQPGQPVLMDTLAMILGAANQLDKALEIEKRVVQLEPDHAPFRLNLAKLYVKAGQKSFAKGELDRLAKLGDKFSGQDEVEKMLKGL